MANLGNSIINGRLRVINETNTGGLTVNGNPVNILVGTIASNTTSNNIVSAKQVVEYLQSKSVTPKFDGGALSASGSNVTIGDTNNGISITVSRAVVEYNGAVNGWVNVADNTDVLASGSITKYISAITVPSGQTLTSVTNNGAITTLNGSGSITTFGGAQEIGTFSSTGRIWAKSSTSRIDSHTGSTTIGTNTGTVTIETPSTGVVNYKNWKIAYNSTNGSLEFLHQ